MAVSGNNTWYNSTGSYGGDFIQYAIQGCYNIVVTAYPSYFHNHSAFRYDCTEMNIASLEATSLLKFDDQQVNVTNANLKLAVDNLRTNDLIYGISVSSAWLAIIFYFLDRAKPRS